MNEWVAIRYYCDSRYRRLFIRRCGGMLSEGISDKLKGLWDKAKSTAKSFLDGIKNIAGNLIPASFLVGLSKLGDAGKKIWEFVSTLAGNAYNWLTETIDKAKAYIEKQKEQLVANVINLILKVIYKQNVGLYNQIVTACKNAGINTGLEVDQKAVQQPVKEGIVGAAIQGANVAGGGVPQLPSVGGNPREIVANLVQQAFDVITKVLTPDLKQQIVNTLFPFKSDSAEAIGITLLLPLAQASGSLSLDTLVQFVSQVVAAVKGKTAAGGKINLFREYKILTEGSWTSFGRLLVNNFDSVTGAIVGMIKGSNIENIVRAAGGDVGAGKAVVSQLLKLLIDAVKKAVGDKSEEELGDEAMDKATEFLMGESVSLVEVIYGK